jgi:hypothetical protein
MRAAFSRIRRVRIGGGHLVLAMRRLFYWVLQFKLRQVLAHRSVNLRGFGQLLSRNAALLGGVGLYEGSIHRELVSPHQTDCEALCYDFLEQPLEHLRLLESPVTVLRKRRVMRNFLIETKTSEPAPS